MTAILTRSAPITRLGPQMPTTAHFTRHHYPPPELDTVSWSLDVGGAVTSPGRFTLGDLRRYPRRELAVVLECAGHRRSEFQPSTPGVPWEAGAVSEATWCGTPLYALLEDVGIADAQFAVLEGADVGTFRNRRSVPFARALPLARALHPDTLLAWEMNGEPLPREHGAPLRVVVPGWYATDSVKWLRRIQLTRDPFAGPFEIEEYRLRSPVRTDPQRLTVLAVHSLLTSHVDRQQLAAGEHTLFGVAWTGAGGVSAVEVSTDGQQWEAADCAAPSSPYSFTRWRFRWTAKPGTWTIRVRAADRAGRTQPEAPEWNEGGYANSSWHRVRLIVV